VIWNIYFGDLKTQRTLWKKKPSVAQPTESRFFSKRKGSWQILFWFDLYINISSVMEFLKMVGPKNQENKVVQKLKLEKKCFFYKKWSPKLIFFNDFFFWKNSIDFWHRKLTLKVGFRHFLTNHNLSQDCLKKFPLSMVILRQKSCILGPTIFKIPQPNRHYCTWRMIFFSFSIFNLKNQLK
jgi:hypothetical protein